MAQFGCGKSRCTCVVTGGPGITVTGNGSAGAPYVVEAEGGGVTCEQVRPCLSAGDGIAYDPGTGEIAARPSTDAGNTLTIGTDGGLLVPPGAPADPVAVEAGDTNTVDTTVSGTGAPGDPYVVSAEVILDPAPPGGGDNLLHAGDDGLYVECADVRGCFSAGNGAAYDPGTGEISARLSTDAGNIISFGTDGGLMATAPAATPTEVEAEDTPTVDMVVNGTGAAGDPYRVSAEVILDPAPPGGGDNLLHAGDDGLYVECADVRGCFSAGNGAAYDPDTGEIAAKISADAGNTTTIGTDGGIYTPAPAGTELQAQDTPTVDMTVSGTGAAGDPYVVSAEVIVDPAPNGLEATPNGLLVTPSEDAGNRLEFGGDGRLYVPPVLPPEVGCGLVGDGTSGSPLAANPAGGQAEWAGQWGCDAATYSTLRCDPTTGALWTPPEHYTADDYIYQEHMDPAIASMGPTGGWVVLAPGGVPAFVQWDIPANFLGNMCRRWGYQGHVHASIDITADSAATFELGYILVVDGSMVGPRPIEAVYTAYGAARRERYAGSVSHAFYTMPASQPRLVVFYPAVNIFAGTIAINSWTSEATLHTSTRAEGL